MPSKRSSLSIAALLATLILSGLPMGCGGGGKGITVPSRPTVIAVTPTGTISTSGTRVVFQATASNSPASFQWSFGGGATPNQSNVAEPSVVLGAPGSYAGSVVAINSAGTSSAFAFSYAVAPLSQPLAPHILSVTPTGAVGQPGQPANFTAQVLNHPTAWLWDFGGGASPSPNTAESAVETLAAAGSYQGSLTVSNPSGNDDLGFAFSVSATPPTPQISAVVPADRVGVVGAKVQFRADATAAPSSWSWDFGTGATPATSTDPTPSVTLGSVGSYSGSVRATNTDGSGPAYTFSYEVVPAPVDPTWEKYALDHMGMTTNAPIFAGQQYVGWFGEKPYVSYLKETPDYQNRLARGLSAFPNAVSNWEIGSQGTRAALPVVIDGKINLLLGETLADLRLQWSRALVPNPIRPEDWESHTVLTQDAPFFVGSASVVNLGGVPGIAFGTMEYPGGGPLTVRELRIAVANNSTPSSAADWMIYQLADVGVYPQSIFYHGRWVLAFNGHLPGTDGGLVVRQALVTVPRSAADWDGHVMYGISHVQVQSPPQGFEVVGDRLYLTHSPDLDLLVSRALVEHPLSAADWDTTLVFSFNGLPNARYGARGFGVLDGRPVITLSVGDLEVLWADTPTPTGSQDWRKFEVIPYGTGTVSALLSSGSDLQVIYQTGSYENSVLNVAVAHDLF